MRRGLIHAGAWLLATGAAVTFSWWGVHTVMAGTVYDPPRALPIPHALPVPGGTPQGSRPQASSTNRPSHAPSPSRAPSPKKPASPAPGRPHHPAASSPSTAPPPPAVPGSRASAGESRSAGTPESVNTEAGRVVFAMGKETATLVSATPAAGWAMQVWKNPAWIRVDFTSGQGTVSVFCTWHDHPPLIEIVKS